MTTYGRVLEKKGSIALRPYLSTPYKKFTFLLLFFLLLLFLFFFFTTFFYCTLCALYKEKRKKRVVNTMV